MFSIGQNGTLREERELHQETTNRQDEDTVTGVLNDSYTPVSSVAVTATYVTNNFATISVMYDFQ